jgi:hypothetical protein
MGVFLRGSPSAHSSEVPRFDSRPITPVASILVPDLRYVSMCTASPEDVHRAPGAPSVNWMSQPRAGYATHPTAWAEIP